MAVILPQTCEHALLERALRAEAMALWAVQSAQEQDIPPHVRTFLERHEADEARHLRQFEHLLNTKSWGKGSLPRVPHQWSALAVHLYGYEVLGLEFAQLLVSLRPDLHSILEDEEAHVGFFEREVRGIILKGDGQAQETRESARAWWKRLPKTVDRYLQDEVLAPYRNELRRSIITAIEQRFQTVGLLDRSSPGFG